MAENGNVKSASLGLEEREAVSSRQKAVRPTESPRRGSLITEQKSIANMASSAIHVGLETAVRRVDSPDKCATPSRLLTRGLRDAHSWPRGRRLCLS